MPQGAHMGKNALGFFLAASAFVVVVTGCESNIDNVKRGSWGTYTTPYEKAFAAAFENGVWTEIKDEKGEKIVQFTGKISKGLHDYTVGKLSASDEKSVFSFACNYLAALMRDGTISKDPDVTFDPAKYPVKNGVFVPALVDGYIGSQTNKPLVTALVDYYTKKYWATGSDVFIQWGVYANGKVLRVKTITNQHWDNDEIFGGKPEIIMKVIFEYAQK